MDGAASFISYRRQASPFLARAVYQNLRAHDYDVFFDIESIDAGSFPRVIDGEIRARPYFLPIFTPATLDRCVEPNDVLCAELKTAVQTQRCIVPLVTREFDRHDVVKYLPPQLADEYRSLNTVTIDHEYFEAAMDKLRRRFLHPVDIPIERLTAEVSSESKRISDAAAKSAPVDQPALSAQKHLERAFTAAKTNTGLAVEEFGKASKLLEQSSELRTLMDDFNLQYLEIQARMQRENAAFDEISALAKANHDLAKAAIRSIR